MPAEPVWWVPRLESETLLQYFCRAQQEAGSTYALAFRKGGSNAIAVRGLVRAQARAWRLSGAPKGWSVVTCLQDVGCTEVAVLGHPRGKLPWLVRAVGPAGHVGVVPIETADCGHPLLLSQVASGSTRVTNEVQRLGAAKTGAGGKG